MKRTYIAPATALHLLQPTLPLAASEFNQGQQQQSVTTTEEEVDKFTTRRRNNVWDDEEDYDF